jgi:hypothetical protein
MNEGKRAQHTKGRRSPPFLGLHGQIPVILQGLDPGLTNQVGHCAPLFWVLDWRPVPI